MKVISKKLSVAVALSALVLGGCGSTPKMDASGKTLPSKINYESKSEFDWDDSKSFALNISLMGSPASLGAGLRDSDTPKSTKIDKDNNSLFSFYSGFVVGGVLGGFGAMSMDSLSEEARSWRPYMLQRVSKSDFANGGNAEVFIKPFIDSISIVLDEKFSGSYVIGDFYAKSGNATYENLIAISGEFCILAAKYDHDGEINPLRELQYRVSDLDNRDISSVVNSCYISLNSNVVGELNGEFLVSHMIAPTNIGVFFGLSVSSDTSLATVFPNEFRGLNMNDGSSSVYTFDAPFVTNNGKTYFFDANESSNRNQW
jgi:hypothetical protein